MVSYNVQTIQDLGFHLFLLLQFQELSFLNFSQTADFNSGIPVVGVYLVKPLLIARAATKGSIAAKIRRIAHDSLIRYISSVTYDTFVNDLVSHKVQTSLRSELNKVYPLRICEIRYMGIVDLERKLAAKAKEHHLE